MRLVLASGSPRRREILAALGLAFDVRPTDADETPRAGERAKALALRVALAKLDAARRAPDEATLVADTVVDVDGAPLGKPESDDDAKRMLRSLSGRTHEVHTAIAVAAGERVLSSVVTTEVVFRPLDEGTIDRYVASGEGRDKAGAYGVQGMAAAMVTVVRGSPSNVIGLPAAETIELLVQAGVLDRWPA